MAEQIKKARGTLPDAPPVPLPETLPIPAPLQIILQLLQGSGRIKPPQVLTPVKMPSLNARKLLVLRVDVARELIHFAMTQARDRQFCADQIKVLENQAADDPLNVLLQKETEEITSVLRKFANQQQRRLRRLKSLWTTRSFFLQQVAKKQKRPKQLHDHRKRVAPPRELSREPAQWAAKPF